jgi:hypothetical protein
MNDHERTDSFHDVVRQLTAWSAWAGQTAQPDTSRLLEVNTQRAAGRSKIVFTVAATSVVVIAGLLLLRQPDDRVAVAPAATTGAVAVHTTAPSPARPPSTPPSATQRTTVPVVDSTVQPRASIDLESTRVAYSGSLGVTATCPGAPGPVLDLEIVDPASGEPLSDVFRLPLAEQESAEKAVKYSGGIQLPYWLGPGHYSLRGFCFKGVSEAAAGFDVIETDLPWDLWRPTSPPVFEPDGSPDGPEGSDFWAAVPGSSAPVSAVCDPAVEPGQARFVLWGTYSDLESSREYPFFAVEYPVEAGGYERTPNGLRISAQLSIDATQVPAPGDLSNPPTVTALCTATATEFAPEGEQSIELSRLEIVFAW